MTNRRTFAALVVVLGIALATWSYASGGFVRVITDVAFTGQDAMGALRLYILGSGVFAPAAYVLAVVVEVVVAPIPGPLVYAPGGVIFGGFVGGTLSLAGNALGTAVAAWIGQRLGEPWVRRRLGGRFDVLSERLSRRGFWVVFLLRVNPLTSSDFVTYAAGAVGIRVRVVTLATFFGMVPLAYAQTYLGPRLFELLPGSGTVLLLFGVVYVVVLAWVLLRA